MRQNFKMGRNISPDALAPNTLLLDIRDELEATGQPLERIVEGHKVVHMAFEDLETGKLPTLPPDAQVIIVCGNGSLGELAQAFLESAGIEADVLEGGAQALKRHQIKSKSPNSKISNE